MTLGKISGRPHRLAYVLGLCLLLGFALRLAGLERGYFSDPSVTTPTFHAFHPDEETLLRAAWRFESLSTPPLTAYGPLPLLLARLTLAGLPTATLDDPATRDVPFLRVRWVAAALSCLSLALVAWIAWRALGPPAACIAACITATAPIAVQQAHFYTVDGLFTLLTLATFAAVLRATSDGAVQYYLLAGLLIGLTATVRLNGALLGLVLAAAHLITDYLRTDYLSSARLSTAPGAPDPWQRLWRRLLDRRLWMAAAAALAVLLCLQPYLLTDPGLLTQKFGTDDFAYSAAVAGGQILRPWSLADTDTLPYVHYWTHLWPLAVGWPLTLAFALALPYTLVRRHPLPLLALIWIVLYFVPIGALHTKHVRYLLPLLPFFALLVAAAAVDLFQRLVARKPPAAVALALGGGLVVLHAALYGLAFTRLYLQEDSRLTASRWIAAHLPPGATVAVERGGFSMQNLIDWDRYTYQSLDMGTLFGTRGYLACAPSGQYLEERLTGVDHIVLVDVNRYRQFTAAPKLFPAVADFYHRLLAGQLGFEPVQRFKNYPALGPVRWIDDAAEPSFLGYDHPAVFVLSRTDGFSEAWQQWRHSLPTLAACPDADARRAADAFLQGQPLKSLGALQQLRTSHPHALYPALLEADVHRFIGGQGPMQQALDRYLGGFEDLGRATYLLPWAAASSLFDLGLDPLALNALSDGTRRLKNIHPEYYPTMARAYAHLAARRAAASDTASAARAYELSLTIAPTPEAFDGLATLATAQGDTAAAAVWRQRARQSQ